MFLLILAACADGSGVAALSIEAVTSVPSGDATGSTWQGQYQTEIYTRACEGACGPVTVGLLTYTFCDVGERDTEYLQITQQDGTLTVEVNDPVSYYEGGVYADGSMEMGGYATDLGGSIEMIALVSGRFSGERLEATARSRIQGTVETDSGRQDIDCSGSHDVTGDWISELAR